MKKSLIALLVLLMVNANMYSQIFMTFDSTKSGAKFDFDFHNVGLVYADSAGENFLGTGFVATKGNRVFTCDHVL